MNWSYSQSSGILLDPDGEIVATGYAGGNCGRNPEGKNNPDMQDTHCIGPLPQGTYRLGSPQNNPHLGPYAIPLTPDEDNEMFGRSGFFIHGDSINHPGCASEGCIIMPRSVRVDMFDSDFHTITVTQ